MSERVILGHLNAVIYIHDGERKTYSLAVSGQWRQPVEWHFTPKQVTTYHRFTCLLLQSVNLS